MFAYLRDVLYAPQNAQLHPEDMPERLHKLAVGLVTVGNFIQENRRFVTALANGDLSCPLPSVENAVAAPAKALHASLAHLAWQTKRVAQGDFKQHVDFMGDFSESFNYMIERLSLAKEAEQRELALEKRRVVELSQAKALFMELAESNQQLVIVTDEACRTILFTNRSLTELEKAKLKMCLRADMPKFENDALRWEYSDSIEAATAFTYSISSHKTAWDGKPAMAHMITDITELREEERRMQEMAYTDALTGVYNRRYGMAYMTSLKAEDKRFCVAFCDLDNLKYCNDTFGHEEGNRYIRSCCGILSDMAVQKVLCRAGGDEFLVICEGVEQDALEAALVQAQDRLERMPLPRGYELARNISFGVAQSTEEQELNLVLSLADERMYAQKRSHKLYNRNSV